MFQLAQVTPPQLAAVEVITEQAGGTEAGDDALAVGDRRGGAERVREVRGFLFLVHDVFLPEQFTVAAVKAHQAAPVSRRRSTRARLRRPIFFLACLRQ